MCTLKLVIHRAAHEIGGNCIELTSSTGHSLLLDAGRPLDAPVGVTEGLVPTTLDTSVSVEGVLLSHPHQDHYGLLGALPSAWPVYAGAACEQLVKLTGRIFGAVPPQNFNSWKSGVPFPIGTFTITPYLIDHSAFDAYMLLIEAHGKRILYSGDFRMHGRKGALVRAIMAHPPENLDALIMEGTNLGSDKPSCSEAELENRFVDLFRNTKGRVFVSWSAQNIDRTVTLYRACLQSNRVLVIDLYTAEVLEVLAKFGRLPRPGWRNLKVVVTSSFARVYRNAGREDFVARMAKFGIAADKLAGTPSKWVIMTRPSLIRDYEFKGVMPTQEDSWCWSMWSGYLSKDDGQKVKSWFDSGQSQPYHIHTSGHASTDDLQKFAKVMNPRVLIPIHGLAWDSESSGFPPILRLADGQYSYV